MKAVVKKNRYIFREDSWQWMWSDITLLFGLAPWRSKCSANCRSFPQQLKAPPPQRYLVQCYKSVIIILFLMLWIFYGSGFSFVSKARCNVVQDAVKSDQLSNRQKRLLLMLSNAVTGIKRESHLCIIGYNHRSLHQGVDNWRLRQ